MHFKTVTHPVSVTRTGPNDKRLLSGPASKKDMLSAKMQELRLGLHTMRHGDEQQAANEGEDGKCGGSVTSCRREVGRDPRSADAHIRLGGALFDEGDNVGAISSYDQAIKINPNIAFVHSNRGDALRLIGDLEGAIAACTSAIHIDPKDASAYLNLGAALATAKDFSGAAMAFQQAIQLEPNSGLAHANLGNCQLESGDLARTCKLLWSEPANWTHVIHLHCTIWGQYTGCRDVSCSGSCHIQKAISLPESRHVSKATSAARRSTVLTDQAPGRGPQRCGRSIPTIDIHFTDKRAGSL